MKLFTDCILADTKTKIIVGIVENSLGVGACIHASSAGRLSDVLVNEITSADTLSFS